MYNGKMPAAKEVLVMEEGDRSECERIMRSRKIAVSKARRAQMLVLAARGLSNRQIALELGASACGWSGAQRIRAAGISCAKGSTSPGSAAQQS